LLNEVVWSRAALAQIRVIRAYVEQFNPRAARALANDLIVAGNALVNLPRRGRKVPGTDMRELVTAHPYIIRYRVVGTTVRILRVRHMAQRPTNP
jgi:addiction module RelE/StbE family toxin